MCFRVMPYYMYNRLYVIVYPIIWQKVSVELFSNKQTKATYNFLKQK